MLSKRLITLDDFIETYCKIKQRGSSFIFSKFTFREINRTKSAFDTIREKTSNWWDIPEVKQRWNLMVSGDKNKNFKSYFVENYFADKSGLKVLSLGSGFCYHEIELAQYAVFEEILCLDIAENALKAAEKSAEEKNLRNISFKCQDVYDYQFPTDYFDIVIFNSSLHHFKNIESLLKEKVKPSLKQNGKLIINEYVGPNRLQFPQKQIDTINYALQRIDKKYRRRSGTGIYKNKYYGCGLVRMYIADPSECVESETICPSIHKHFKVIEEKGIGGNILMGVFKDIAYNFLELNQEKKELLQKTFDIEDSYLKNNPSDYLIGIYEKVDE